mmetsp:Transcript_6410/g.16410  ORF Transcript_6410/g.16410 Transcript_6410/m.16410 type:complete len:244 (+) Transcript_6410:92-823(+)
MRCYNCGETGHIARDCANEAPTCYGCGQVGHVSRDCPNQVADPQLTDPQFIYSMAMNAGLEERQPGNTELASLFFVNAQTGVVIDVLYGERSIKASADQGQTWRASGYHSVESLERLLAKPRAGGTPAAAAQTRAPRARTQNRPAAAGGGGGGGAAGKPCWNCGSTMHLSRDCPEPPAEGADAEGRRGARKPPRGQRCFNCGETGHIAGECAYKEVGPKCYRCGQFGHIGRDCPNPTQAEGVA